jgi:microcystin-dependent protein
MSITPLSGDRAAHDVSNHPGKHASDLEAGTPIHHVPAGSTNGDTLTWNGSKWVVGAGGGGITLQQVYPVGSIYISVVSTNPATLFGFGTWAAFATGRTLVGIDAGQTEFDVVEETGGAKTHTLTSAEMPSHTHVQNAHTHVQNAHAHNVLGRDSGAIGATARVTNASSAGTVGDNPTSSVTAVNQNATATNQNTGGGGAHNNLQPYVVVYMWKRTA